MHHKVKELWHLLEEIRDDTSITTQDALLIIGLLKTGESAIMLSCMYKEPLFPPEEKK